MVLVIRLYRLYKNGLEAFGRLLASGQGGLSLTRTPPIPHIYDGALLLLSMDTLLSLFALTYAMGLWFT